MKKMNTVDKVVKILELNEKIRKEEDNLKKLMREREELRRSLDKDYEDWINNVYTGDEG